MSLLTASKRAPLTRRRRRGTKEPAPSPHDLARGDANPNPAADAATRLQRVERLLKELVPCYLRLRHLRPWHLWAPRMGALLGLRTGEVAMASTHDLEERAGRWFWRVHQSQAGPLSASRCRLVPIPVPMVEAGFVAFVQQCEHGWLFPELKRTTRYGYTLEQYVRSRALASADTSLHGMTYGDLRQSCIDAMAGHAEGPFATAAFMGYTLNELWASALAEFESWRDPDRLVNVVDASRYPALVNAPAPDGKHGGWGMRHYRWSHQREVPLDSNE